MRAIRSEARFLARVSNDKYKNFSSQAKRTEEDKMLEIIRNRKAKYGNTWTLCNSIGDDVICEVCESLVNHRFYFSHVKNEHKEYF